MRNFVLGGLAVGMCSCSSPPIVVHEIGAHTAFEQANAPTKSVTPPPNSQVERPGETSAEIMNGIDRRTDAFLLAHPEVKQAAIAAFRAAAINRYREMVSRLHLSPADGDRFYGIVSAGSEELVGHDAIYGADHRMTGEEYKRQLTDLLGESGYRQFVQYTDEVQGRDVVEQMVLWLYDTKDALRPDQVRLLTQHAEQLVGNRSVVPSVSPLWAELPPRFWSKLLDVAGTFLSAPQMATLRELKQHAHAERSLCDAQLEFMRSHATATIIPQAGFTQLVKPNQLLRDLWTEDKHVEVMHQVGKLFCRRNWADERRASFVSLYVRSMADKWDLEANMIDQGKPIDDPDVKRAVDGVDRMLDKQLRELVGDAEFAEYQQFVRTFDVRSFADGLAVELASTLPLTFIQAEALEQALVRGTVSSMKTKLDPADIDWIKVDAEAAIILTPAQFEVWRLGTAKSPYVGTRFDVELHRVYDAARNASI